MQDIIDHYNKVSDKTVKLTASREKLIEKNLKIHTKQDILDGITGGFSKEVDFIDSKHKKFEWSLRLSKTNDNIGKYKKYAGDEVVKDKPEQKKLTGDMEIARLSAGIVGSRSASSGSDIYGNELPGGLMVIESDLESFSNLCNSISVCINRFRDQNVELGASEFIISENLFNNMSKDNQNLLKKKLDKIKLTVSPEMDYIAENEQMLAEISSTKTRCLLLGKNGVIISDHVINGEKYFGASYLILTECAEIRIN